MDLSGIAVRPPGSDAYWPPVGTRVPWAAVRPIRDLYAQGRRHGFPSLGILGNTDHLRKHGDHTPWSLGKTRGLVWAGDWDMPDEFLPWMISYCKSPAPTGFIDFWNFRGGLYNYAGARQRDSLDGHFHLSTDQPNAVTTLIDDFARDHALSEDTMSFTEQIPIGDLRQAFIAAGSTPKESDNAGRVLNLAGLRGLEATKAAREEGARTRDELSVDHDQHAEALAALTQRVTEGHAAILAKLDQIIAGTTPPGA